jgi:hypothetical protein
MQILHFFLVLLCFEVIMIEFFQMVGLSLPQITNLLLFCLLHLKISSVKSSMLPIQLK